MNEHVKNERTAICSCPYCNGAIAITREDVEKGNPKRCSYCGKVIIPYINEENELSYKSIDDKEDDESYEHHRTR